LITLIFERHWARSHILLKQYELVSCGVIWIKRTYIKPNNPFN
jgi:hypothetical protein